jgi:hypothetical protein
LIFLQGGIYTLFLKSSFAVASLLVRYVNEEKAQKERGYKAPTYNIKTKATWKI